MALALSIPYNFPERELVIVVSFGVVLFTLLVPGLSMESLVAILKINGKEKSFEAYQSLKARLAINTLALDAIKQRQAVNRISDKTFNHIESRLNSRNVELVEAIQKLHLTDDSVQILEEQLATRELLELQKDHLAELVKTGNLNPESAHEIAIQLDQEQSDMS